MFLALDQWLLWAACTLYFHLIFLDHVNQCRVQLGTNKVVLLQAFIIIRQRQTLHPAMDHSLFFMFLLIFEKVVKWGSGSFEFYLLVRVILHECHSIQGHSRDVTQ